LAVLHQELHDPDVRVSTAWNFNWIFSSHFTFYTVCYVKQVPVLSMLPFTAQLS